MQNAFAGYNSRTAPLIVPTEMSMPKKKSAETQKQPASAALENLSPAGATLAEFEMSMIVFWNTFSRWVERCGQAAGVEESSTFDLLILHFLRLRGRPLRAVDIGFALSVEDQHLVSYSVRKLVRQGLLRSEKNGKEILYTPTHKSDASYRRYIELRQKLLVSATEMIQNPTHDIVALGAMLRALSGIYEQAARAAAQEWHSVGT
jgi:predicted MarR family transcription regulator